MLGTTLSHRGVLTVGTCAPPRRDCAARARAAAGRVHPYRDRYHHGHNLRSTARISWSVSRPIHVSGTLQDNRTDCWLLIMDLEVGFSTDHDDAQAAATESSESTLLTVFVLPSVVQRVGKVLSGPDGNPTRLYRGAMLYLTAYPVFVALIGWSTVYPSVPALAAAGESGKALCTFVECVGLGLVGTGSLASLRVVSRPRCGHLTQLGAGTVQLSQPRTVKFQHWTWVVTGLHSIVLLTIVAFAWLDLSLDVTAVLIFDIGWLATVVACYIWWYTLKAACTLTGVAIDNAIRKARAELHRLRDSGATMDLDRWKDGIEKPMLDLVEIKLPALSDGWGRSVGVVGSGLVMVAVGQAGGFLYPWLSSTGVWVALTSFHSQAYFDQLTLLFDLFTVMLPFLLAVDPASVSNQCSRLQEELNHIAGRDSSFVPATNFVSYLKHLNKDQGLGAHWPTPAKSDAYSMHCDTDDFHLASTDLRITDCKRLLQALKCLGR